MLNPFAAIGYFELLYQRNGRDAGGVPDHTAPYPGQIVIWHKLGHYALVRKT